MKSIYATVSKEEAVRLFVRGYVIEWFSPDGWYFLGGIKRGTLRPNKARDKRRFTRMILQDICDDEKEYGTLLFKARPRFS